MKILVPQYNGIFRIAADEFVSLHGRMTGEHLEIVTEDSPTDDLIVLGGDDVCRFTHDLIDSGVLPALGLRIETDDFRMISGKDSARTILCLAGGRDRALMYAVYAWFERLGCAWFQDGDRVPKISASAPDSVDVLERPRFSYRMIRYFAHRGLKRFQAELWDWEDWKREIDYLLKRRFNLFMLRIGLDDLFQKAFPDVVPYPEGFEVPESISRSYNDRNLFWSMEYRAELRKKILAYAQARDLLHPEDVGTPTHWYSRTPLAYLRKMKPSFVPQSASAYHEETGLAWDIRDERNLDAYFKLTEAHIEHYGKADIFHTIGLAERLCYSDKKRNHAFKLYVYRRIIRKLREHYPDAPLLIGTWDFSTFWTAEEVRQFVAELDPERNLIFDYTADTDDPERNFQNWGLVGKFPWIFGVFSAYESETDIRGDYRYLADRLAVAAKDPMCRGVAFWPEASHTDILIQEFVSLNAWNPVHTDPEMLVSDFCRRRYAENAAPMRNLWNAALPLIALRGFRGPVTPRGHMAHEVVFDLLHWLNFRDFSEPWMLAHRQTADVMDPVLKTHAAAFLRKLADASPLCSEEWIRRDVLDLAKSTLGRILHGLWSDWMLALDAWRKGTGTRENAERYLSLLEASYRVLSGFLPASREFSLNATFEELFRNHPFVPGFENTLKGNALNHYCRSYVSELCKEVYLPEFAVYRDFAERQFNAGSPEKWEDAAGYFEAESLKIQDRFFSTPLAAFLPDFSAAEQSWPSLLRNFAEVLEESRIWEVIS